MAEDPLKTMLMFGKDGKKPSQPDVRDTLRDHGGSTLPTPDVAIAPQETDAGIEDAPPPPPSETLQAGTTVGDYVVTTLLDIGGMGAVYAGEHPKIGKRVAIKVLHAAVANDPLVKGRFLQEARAVNRIQHPNIVDVFTFGELSDGRPYFVMDLLEGACLRDRLLAAAPMSADEAFRVFIQVCNALEAAHAAGVVHRDLKPENIYVTRGPADEPIAKLLDFGVAKVLQPEGAQPILRTRAGYRVGTPRYMAPEQLKGRPVDHRADIYALGLSMYEVFTGDWPWDAKTEYELTVAHLKNPPRSNEELFRRCPELSRLIMRCLEKEPQARPQSAAEVGAALREARKLWPVSFSHVSRQGIITALQHEAVKRKRAAVPSDDVSPSELRRIRSRAGLWFVVGGLVVGGTVVVVLTMLR